MTAALATVWIAAGCADLEQQYGPKTVRVPTPVAGGLTGGEAATPIKPIRSGPVQRSGGLTQPVIRTEPGGAFNQIAPAVVGDGGDAFSLNFVDTDIREVVEVVLGQTLGLNYVYDDRVEGRVTARTSQPVRRADVLPVLENILALNGAALVRAGGVYNVAPVDAAGALPKVVVTPSTSPQSAGIGAYVVPLRYASVDSVSDIALSLVSPGNQLAVDQARNLLIYTGPAVEAQAVADLVAVLDVDVLSGKSLGLFPLKSSRAEDVAGELESIFVDPALGGAQVRFLQVQRLNAILAIAPTKRQIEQARYWITQLDNSASGANRQVYVYHAKNSRADELVEVLTQIFKSSGAEADEAQDAVAPGLSPVRVFRPAAGVQRDGQAAAAPPLPGPDGPLASGGGDGMRIVADKRNNSVVVIATDEEFRLVEATLRQIDIQQLQVLIEATIAEVTLQDDLEFGLQWAFSNGDVRASLNNNSSRGVLPSFPGFNFILNTSDVRVVLSALAEVTDVKVVSSPQLMVLDNQSARLQVGDQVPVQVGQTTTDGGSQVDAIEYIDTGVILEVTPRVNASGLVTLEINQEVSDAVQTQSSSLNSPTIQQRSISSIVSVQSGETIALGGLIRERASEGESGLPILKDIPVLGNAFKTTDRGSLRTELLVLITPRVVRGGGEARDVTEELRRRLSALGDVVQRSN